MNGEHEVLEDDDVDIGLFLLDVGGERDGAEDDKDVPAKMLVGKSN